MDDSTMYCKLQSAVERSRGAASWTDVSLVLMRLREAKVQMALHAAFEDMPLEDILQAERIANNECFKVASKAQTKKAK